MKVKEVMVEDVKTIDQGKTIQEAARVMADNRVGSLIVVKGEDQLAGIITEGDIIREVVSEGKDSGKIKVKEIMSGDVIMIEPEEDIESAVELMLDQEIKKLPVVTGSSLVGIVTTTDIAAAEPKLIEKISEITLIPKGKKVVAG